MASTDITVAVDKRGRTTPLGEFVFRLLGERGMSVSALSREANLSRSFLYLLKDDRQVPSLDTLVALFEAIGVDDVRVADPGEPGELAISVDDRQWWIRLPASNRRTERSVAAWQTLSASAAPEEPLMAGDAAMTAPVLAVGSVTYSRDRDQPMRSSRTNERQRLLNELLAAAGELDKQRLELLIEHAKLMGRG